MSVGPEITVEVLDDGAGNTLTVEAFELDPDTPTTIEIDSYLMVLQRLAAIEGMEGSWATTTQLTAETEARVAGDATLASQWPILAYNGTQYPVRPAVAGPVIWKGPVDPGTAALDGDLWLNTL